jgi:glycosyltransferase involved in cell wall biosynthesis
MQELLVRGHEVAAIFPDLGLPGSDYDKYYGNSERYRIVPFPATYNNVELYTFPLIIPDPNPRNYKHAWTFRDMSEMQLKAYIGYMRQEIKRLIDEFKPDMVECQHIWAIDHIIHELGYQYACVAHHSDQMGFHYDARMRDYAKFSANQAKYIFAISDYVRDEVLDLYGVSPDKVVTIANGYDQAKFKPFPVDREAELSRLGLSEYSHLPIITFCGKISKTKGVDVLLKANKLIQQKQKALVLILGGGDFEELQQQISGNYSLENVVYLGHRSQQELATLHNLATLSVLPSRSEGFGIAALEAMGCAKPLVATRVGGLANFAVGGLVEPEDEVGLAQAITDVLKLPEDKYRKLCCEALATARRYSWSEIVNRRLEYYEEIAFLNRWMKRRVG